MDDQEEKLRDGIMPVWTEKDDEALFDSIEVLKNQGWIEPYDHIEDAIKKLCIFANIKMPKNLT